MTSPATVDVPETRFGKRGEKFRLHATQKFIMLHLNFPKETREGDGKHFVSRPEGSGNI